MFDFMLAYGGNVCDHRSHDAASDKYHASANYLSLAGHPVCCPGTPAYSVMEPYFLPLWLVVLTVVIIGVLSYLAIVRIYSKRES